MKLQYTFPVLALACFILILTGCIKDDLDDCIPVTEGMNISFYSKTSCALDTTYLDSVGSLFLCVFDKNDLLVAYRQKDSAVLTRNYTETIGLSQGLYSIICWSGIDSTHFDIGEVQEGKTNKTDLLFRLKRAQGIATGLTGTKVYYGQNSGVYVEKTATVPTPAKVNMQEITNRLSLTIEGLSEKAEDYEIVIESNNGSMNLNGTLAKDETIIYTSSPLFESGLLKAEFTLLKLETGYTHTLLIRSKTNEAELFRGGLLGTLLLKNPEVNLNCDHDFTIEFTAEDQCACGTYTLTEIWVNNWLVHSYDKEL